MFSVVKNFGITLRKPKSRIGLKYLNRTVAGDKFRPLNEDTLTGRFLLYLKNFKPVQDVISNDCYDLFNKLKYHPRNIVKFNTSQIIKVLTHLTNREYIQNKQDFSKIFNLIDADCCDRLKDQNIQGTLNLLHSFLAANPNRLKECQYFSLALDALMKATDKLSKEELIQTIFFIGFFKKCEKAQNMLQVCLRKLNEQVISNLTQEDLCIICNSTFKTSTQIKNNLLLKKVKYYINEHLFLLKDPAVFVTLIKTLRQNRFQDEDILATLSCTIFFNKTISCYSFAAIGHILALYSDYLYYDEPLLKAFSEEGTKLLKQHQYTTKGAYLLDQPRLKDIKRFLWALSNLNYKLSKEDIEGSILPQVRERMNDSEPGIFVDIILYLWMMQYKASDLIKHCLTKEKIQMIKATNSTSQRSLNLLLTCIYYEDTGLYNTLKLHPDPQNSYNINRQLQKKRSVLKNIIDHFNIIAKENDIDKYVFQCQVPFINIVGITGFQKKIYKAVNIEVLDDYTCLKNTDGVPTGLMDLKLRLLDKCDEALIILRSKDLTNCNDAELRDILVNELALVC